MKNFPPKYLLVEILLLVLNYTCVVMIYNIFIKKTESNIQQNL